MNKKQILPDKWYRRQVLRKICEQTRILVCNNPEERAAFEKWYFEKYGKPYEWEGGKNVQTV